MSTENGKWKKAGNRNIYQVPDGYFDELPMRIQTRMRPEPAGHGVLFPRLYWQWMVSGVAAAVMVWIVAIYTPMDDVPVDLLAEVSTEAIITYLQDSELTTDELLATVDYGDVELDMDVTPELLNEELTNEELDQLLDEVDLELL